MSIRLNGKIIAGNSKSTYIGFEICDIGMSLYVDESKGKRRYLNGQIVDINTNTQAFLNRLQQITTLYPSLLTTEDEWQAEKTLSKFGQVGKFVFNYADDGVTVESIRIPAIVNVQGLFDLQNLGLRVDETLPNFEGDIDTILPTSKTYLSGIFSKKAGGINSGNACQTYTNTPGIIHASGSDSSSTYQDNAPVQQEAIQYPYFIQIATGSETENNIVNDIELNNPYSLFDFKWADHELNNLSWTRADNFDWKPSGTYPSAYNELLAEYNNAESVEEIEGEITFKRTPKGYKIALADQETAIGSKYETQGIAWYYILDTENAQFKLPRTKFGFEGLRDGVGNDIAESLPNITGQFDIRNYNNSDSTTVVFHGEGAIVFDSFTTEKSYLSIAAASSGYYKATEVKFNASNSNSTYQDNAPVQERATQMYLYFYVGETVQNANLIDAGRIGENLAKKVDINSKVIDGQWINSDINIIYGTTTLASLKVNTYDLSNYLPNDGYEYEVTFCIKGLTGSTNGNVAEIIVWSTSENNYLSVAYSITRSSATVGWAGTGTVKIGTDRVINVKQNASMACTCNLFRIAGYRRIGTNI